MSAPVYNKSSHRFALLTAVATFVLIGAGGLVTSHGVGMAVPDWPNSYGYNMFFFPISKWIGGIFYEHTHRLIASGVGMLTSILALWLYGRKARPFMRWTGLILLVGGIANEIFLPKLWQDGIVSCVTGLALLGASFIWPRCEPAVRWLRRLGLIAFFAVVLQGVLGGLRVVLLDPKIGIFHATLAQLFFALVCAIALFTSKWWQNLPSPPTPLPSDGRGEQQTGGAQKLGPFVLLATGLILFQLILGATMRHQHAGLAIPDFPLAYGKIWPAMDAASVAHYNEMRVEYTSPNPITAFQIALQMVHRIMALLILIAVTLVAVKSARQLGRRHPISKISFFWVGLILVQATLGAATIWSNKAADIATAHV
ncbi:MAG TPA: COX15/CtaA family protein, partial [Verrucomicrobiae bacterium]|nr:COX15/CtaA family protein [Verrucomicrobiae bacterium]